MLISIERLKELGFNPKGVIHIGGHRGEEQPLYDALGVQMTVWIEALPELVAYMKDKFKHRIPKDIYVRQGIISDKYEEAPFYITNNLASSSLLELGTHKRHHPHIHITKEIKIVTHRLDFHFMNMDGFDCLNLDIQGAELKALKGADLSGIEWIYTEVNEEYVYEDCALIGEIDEYLEDFERIETEMTKYAWGDCLYKRKPLE